VRVCLRRISAVYKHLAIVPHLESGDLSLPLQMCKKAVSGQRSAFG
jgi:hypothetical protein